LSVSLKNKYISDLITITLLYFILYLPFVLVYFTERWQSIFPTSILRFYSILLFHKSIIIFLSTCWEKSQACRSCMPRAWKSITHFYEENRKVFCQAIFFSHSQLDSVKKLVFHFIYLSLTCIFFASQQSVFSSVFLVLSASTKLYFQTVFFFLENTIYL
jgi:hypothetical protein